jgi:predicted Rossmann fold nucleotide-binding protein DprA/Smf involved in DNA uptake
MFFNLKKGESMSAIRKDVAAQLVSFIRNHDREPVSLATLAKLADAARSSVVQALTRLVALGIVEKNDGLYIMNEAHLTGDSWRVLFKKIIKRNDQKTKKSISVQDIRKNAEIRQALAEEIVEACQKIEYMEQDRDKLIVERDRLIDETEVQISELSYKIEQAKTRLAGIEAGDVGAGDVSDNSDPEYLLALKDFQKQPPVVNRVIVDNKAGAAMLTPREVSAIRNR